MKKILFDTLYQIGAYKIFKLGKCNTLTVLSLHRISNEIDFFWNPIKLESFERLIKHLMQNYKIITFCEIIDLPNKVSSKPYLILSFDDGYYDFLEHALPILVKYSLPCNHNVVNTCANNNEIIWTQRLNNIFNAMKKANKSNCFYLLDSVFHLSMFNNNWMFLYMNVYRELLTIQQKERIEIITKMEQRLVINTYFRMMNWDEIIECTKNKVEIGSHSYSHDVMTTITDIELLNYETINSKMEIEEKIKMPCTIFSLPNGQYNNVALQDILENNFIYVLQVDDKINNKTIFTNKQTHLVSRINMVEESFSEMTLRVETFQSKIRKYAKL